MLDHVNTSFQSRACYLLLAICYLLATYEYPRAFPYISYSNLLKISHGPRAKEAI